MKTFRKFIAALLALGCALSLSACGQVEAVENQLFAMNSSVSLKAYGKNAEAGSRPPPPSSALSTPPSTPNARAVPSIT